jgi:hypothetical protein
METEVRGVFDIDGKARSLSVLQRPGYGPRR